MAKKSSTPKTRSGYTGLAATIKQAIDDDERSVYAISQAAGVAYAQVSRFLSGERDITLSTADKLVSVLNLSLQASSTGRRKKTDS